MAYQRLVVVEDVATSGGQILLSTRELRILGAHIVRVVCVIDRAAGGAAALAAEGLELAALFGMDEINALANKMV